MTEDLQYSSRSENKRKFGDEGGATSPSPVTPASGRRSTGFSAPIVSPNSGAAAISSYNNVPPPPDGIELAKKRAQEIAARIFSVAESKRPRVENDGGVDDSANKGFSSVSQLGGTNLTSFSHGYASSSKRIEIPNGRVGVIIGKSGETIKYLQAQSGARIQITRDIDADPSSQTRSVDLVGTPEQISKADQLINEVLSESDAGGSNIVSARKFSTIPANSEHFSMKVPNNKVGLIIGKGGEKIRSMQATCGAHIQVIPLHLPPGDTSTERTVHIDGTTEQIELAKQLVNDVINSESRTRNPQSGGYLPPRPPASWAPSGAPAHMQQPSYGGYMQQPGAYPGSAPQYMSQPSYSGYPPSATSGWAQSPNVTTQQTTPATGYDYYSQQQSQQQQPVGGSSVSMDGSNYNYNQMATAYGGQAQYAESAYSQPTAGHQQSYGQSADYNPQAGYAQQSYTSAVPYGNTVASTQDGANAAYGAQGSIQQSSVQGTYSQSAPSAVYAQPVGQKSQAFVQGPQGSQVYGHSAQGYSQAPVAPSGYAQNSQQAYGLQGGYGGQQQAYAGALPSQTGYATQHTQLYADAYSQPTYSTDGASATAAEPAVASGVTKASPQS